MKLSERLSRRTLLLDGAMGTELHRRGVDIGLPLWSANALLRAPETVRQIHREYVEAGADILTTNTFRTNVRTLQRAGYGEQWEALNRLAVELATDAAKDSTGPVLIAGGLAPVEDCYSPHLVPPDEELRDEHSRQAQLLASLETDFLLVETMGTVREARIALEACAQIGKEFAVSFITDNDGLLLSGESLEDAIRASGEFAPVCVLVNCVSARHIVKPLEIALRSSRAPAGCYANIGTPVLDGTHMQQDVSPDEYLDAAREWIHRGARSIGGCCGTTPDHIRSIARLLHTLHPMMTS